MFSWLKKKFTSNPNTEILEKSANSIQRNESLYDYGLAFKASVTSPASREKMLFLRKENKLTDKEIFDIEDTIIGNQMDLTATTNGTFHEMFVLKELYDNSLVLKNVVKYYSIKEQVEDLKLAYLLKLDYLDINPDRSVVLPDYMVAPTNIILKGNEQFYYKINAKLIKNRRRTKSVTYGGLTASLKICKGVHYRTGNIETARQVEEYLNIEDDGIIAVTNQRIIYLGKNHTFVIPISKILNIKFNQGVLYIYKVGKETPYMLAPQNEKFLIAIIYEIIEQCQKLESSNNLTNKQVSYLEQSSGEVHSITDSVKLNNIGVVQDEKVLKKHKIEKKKTICKKQDKSNIVELADIEIDAFNIVKHILKGVIPDDKIYYRCTTGYMAVLYDNKNYKWICRLKFRKANKYIVLPDGSPNGLSIAVNSVSNLLDYEKQIIGSAKRFLD